MTSSRHTIALCFHDTRWPRPTARRPVREPGFTTPPDLSPHGKTAEGAVLQVGLRSPPQTSPLHSLLSPLSAAGRASAGWWKRPVANRHPLCAQNFRRAPSLKGISSIAPGCRVSGYPGDPAIQKLPEACRASLDRRTPHDLRIPPLTCNRQQQTSRRPGGLRHIVPCGCPGLIVRRGLRPHGKTVEAPYSKLGATAPPLLSTFSCLLSRPQAAEGLLQTAREAPQWSVRWQGFWIFISDSGLTLAKHLGERIRRVA